MVILSPPELPLKVSSAPSSFLTLFPPSVPSPSSLIFLFLPTPQGLGTKIQCTALTFPSSQSLFLPECKPCHLRVFKALYFHGSTVQRMGKSFVKKDCSAKGKLQRPGSRKNGLRRAMAICEAIFREGRITRRPPFSSVLPGEYGMLVWV